MGWRPPARRRPGDGAGIRAELAEARADARAAALEQLRADIEALGASVGYTSSNPLRWSSSICRRIASMTWPPCRAYRASGSSGHGRRRCRAPGRPSAQLDKRQRGSGRRRPGGGRRIPQCPEHGRPRGRVVASHSTSGALPTPPAAWTTRPGSRARSPAGGTYAGVAPGADIVSSSTGGGGASLTRDRQHDLRGRLGRQRSRWRRRHRQRQHRPGHGHRFRGGQALLRRHGQRGRPAGRGRGRQLHDIRELGHRVAGHRLQRDDRRRHRTTARRRDEATTDLVHPGSNGSNYHDRSGTRHGTRTATTTSRTCPRRRHR